MAEDEHEDKSSARGARSAIVFVSSEELANHEVPAKRPLPALSGGLDTEEIHQSAAAAPTPRALTVPETTPMNEDAATQVPEPSPCPRCDTENAFNESLGSCDFCGFYLGETDSRSNEESVLDTVNRIGKRRHVDRGVLAAASIFGLLFCGSVIGIFSTFAGSEERNSATAIENPLPEPLRRTAAIKPETDGTSTERIQAFISMVKKVHAERTADTMQSLPAGEPESTPVRQNDSFALSDKQVEFLFPDISSEPNEQFESEYGLWECTRYGDDTARITNNPNAGVDVNCVPASNTRGTYNKLSPGQTITW